MKEIVDFLNLIVENNNRPWFQQHKDLYINAQNKFNAIAEQILIGVQKFDPLTRGLTLKDCTYRFYRDTRFSPDKSPYKRHFGLFICPNGKKSGLAGYYFHVEGEGAEYLGHHGLYPGMYMCEPFITKSVREDISTKGDEFVKALKKAKNFSMDFSSKLKKVPKDYPADHPYAEYLKLKDFCLYENISNDRLFSKDLVDWVVGEFRSCYDFNSFLNRAALFAMENK